MGIIIENPGILTTIQDEGRFGYQQFGVSPAGPMDTRSFYIANPGSAAPVRGGEHRRNHRSGHVSEY